MSTNRVLLEHSHADSLTYYLLLQNRKVTIETIWPYGWHRWHLTESLPSPDLGDGASVGHPSSHHREYTTQWNVFHSGSKGIALPFHFRLVFTSFPLFLRNRPCLIISDILCSALQI